MTNPTTGRQSKQSAAGLGKEGRLTSGPLLDWFYVHAGYVNNQLQWDVPQGIEVEVQPCEKSEPLIEPDRPWEKEGLSHLGRLYFKDGKYRLYYTASRSHFCVAESEDGFNWTKPELGLVEFEGSSKNNMIPGVSGYVFEDPSAPPEERFKSIGSIGGMFEPDLDSEGRPVSFKPSTTAMDMMGKPGEASSTDILQLQESQRETYKGKWSQLKKFLTPVVSPDGLRWTELKDHLMLGEWVDGDKVAYHDEELGKYIAYLRFHMAGRRCVGRSESVDFRKFTPEEVMLQPDSMDPPDTSFYHHSYTRYPGRDDLHLMFVTIYHQGTGHLDVQLAVSHDSLHWDRPDRRTPIIPNGPEGSGDSGMIFACPELQLLPDGRYAIAYSGTARLHNQGDPPHPGRQGIIRYGMWQKDRLVGIRARGHGRLTLRQDLYRASENCPDSTEAPPNDRFPPLRDPNEPPRQLRLNYRTESGGWVRVELIPLIGPMPHPQIPAMEGYGFEDCDTLAGDGIDKVVTWKGKDNIARLSDTLAVRIEMYKATLFSFSL